MVLLLNVSHDVFCLFQIFIVLFVFGCLLHNLLCKSNSIQYIGLCIDQTFCCNDFVKQQGDSV